MYFPDCFIEGHVNFGFNCSKGNPTVSVKLGKIPGVFPVCFSSCFVGGGREFVLISGLQKGVIYSMVARYGRLVAGFMVIEEGRK